MKNKRQFILTITDTSAEIEEIETKKELTKEEYEKAAKTFIERIKQGRN